ncbi:MAG: hypothetical protein GTO51_06990 [Candidatus Latescibacteria bacterium]|nr:hypothetical protein [Candidatus Latescibacterota bacterium]NIM21546.1 hypothetical protein [Candidatus Latescibacterota bacterium]NIM65717.1 hypothetical protein [Candidatus Latescibacterota bacterium]NIO02099.1 hypothetical protein [Candidatus Latescibacterota bacterium]NIO28911.1 hypothetical protein [Candidatus Latescibacterota bacterium]
MIKKLLTTTAIIIISAAAILLALFKGPLSPGPKNEFDTMEDFLSKGPAASKRASRTAGKTANDKATTKTTTQKPPHQVVFIGLDGATWKIIDPMIEEGILPTFKRLKEEGASGILRSVECFFSPPAWTTMQTGYLPEKSGIYTFGSWSGEGNLFHTVSSLDVEVPFVWDVASAAGRRVGVTNMPVTYPVRPVNGIMVSGLLTPISYESEEQITNCVFRTHQGKFYEALDSISYGRKIVGRTNFLWSRLALGLYDTTDDNEENLDTVALKVSPMGSAWKPGKPVPVQVFKIDKWSPWFQLYYREGGPKGPIRKLACSVNVHRLRARGLIKVSPLMRLPSDPKLEMTYPETLGREIEETFGHYLISLGFNPELVPQGVQETAKFASFFYDYDDWDLFLYTFMAPDNIQHQEGVSNRTKHAYKTIDRFLAELLERMPADATLILASDHGFAEFEYAIDLNKFFEDISVLSNSRNVNFDKSLAFTDRWCVYFNEKLLTRGVLMRRGIPIEEGQEPRETLIAYMKEEAKNITDPETGRAFPVELIEVPEDAAGNPPAMIVTGAYSDYFVEGSDLRINSPKVVRRANKRESWYHERNGMYLLWGNHIQAGIDAGIRNIQDITPTILYLMDLPLAKDFDGEVIDTAIRPEFLAQKSTYYLRKYAELTPARDASYEELQSLEDMLKTLGYIR